MQEEHLHKAAKYKLLTLAAHEWHLEPARGGAGSLSYNVTENRRTRPETRDTRHCRQR